MKLSKPPYPSYNQFVLAIRNQELQLSSEAEQERSPHMNRMKHLLANEGDPEEGDETLIQEEEKTNCLQYEG